MRHAIRSERARRGRRLWRAGLALALAGVLASCAFFERYAPEMVAIGGTAVEVAALLNFQDQPEYQAAVTLLMATMTPVATSMAADWSARRQEQRELAKLEKLESEIQNEYQTLEQQSGTASWGQASATPPPQQGYDGPPSSPGQASWGSAHTSVPAPPSHVQAAQQAQGQSQGSQPGYPPSQPPQPGAGPTSQPQPGGPPPQPGGGTGGSSGSPWGDQYATKGGDLPEGVATRGEEAGTLALQVAVLKRAIEGGDVGAEAIADGDVLYDGWGEDPHADRLKVYFSPSEDAYVYVIAIDAIGRVQPLFPRQYPDTTNPVPAGAQIVLPEASDWYGLDKYTGIQHVFFYASRAPQRSLVAQMARFATRPLPEPSGEKVHAVTEPTVVERDVIQARGLTNVRPMEVVEIPGEGDATEAVEAMRVGGLEAGDVIVSRYFEHR